MKKRIIALIAIVMLLAVVFVACNAKPYKQDAVTGADANAAVISNGGMAVQLGDYLYFLNGYVGTDKIDNTFGVPYKSGIWRVTLNADGAIETGSAVRIVPKNVIDSSTNPSIYIYKGYIYYATPNTEKDKTGTENTTYLDFYRTTIDASLTEKIATVDSRSIQYAFYENYLIYIDDGAIYSVNAETKKTTAIVEEKLSTATLVLAPSGGEFTNTILFTRTLPDELSGETYNELCSIKPDGTGLKVIITGNTYTTDKNDVKNIFKISVLSYKVESDGLTLYYTKSYTSNSSSTSAGTYCYKFENSSFTFNKANEKQLSTTALSSIIPINYENGLLVVENSVVDNYVYSTTEIRQAIGRSVTVRFIDGEYIYYTETSNVEELYRFRLDGTGVEELVFNANIYTTGVVFDIVGDYVYFITTDYNYLYRYNLDGECGLEPELVGKMTDEDIAAIAAKEDEKE